MYRRVYVLKESEQSGHSRAYLELDGVLALLRVKYLAHLRRDGHMALRQLLALPAVLQQLVEGGVQHQHQLTVVVLVLVAVWAERLQLLERRTVLPLAPSKGTSSGSKRGSVKDLGEGVGDTAGLHHFHHIYSSDI